MSVPALYRDLAERASALAQRSTAPACGCGVDRDPVRIIDGCLSILVCRSCGGRTTERKGS